MTDVLIVGAGPVGLCCAIDLLRRGVSCRIIEKSPQFAVGTRARGISARTQEIFESLGVLSSIRQFAEPNLPTLFYDRGGHVVRETPASKPVPPSPEVPYPNPLMISQQNTDTVLRERLAELGGTVEMNSTLAGITQYGETVVASVARPGEHKTIAARYVIGCDGGASNVRKFAKLPFAGETWEDAASYLIGNLLVTGLDRDHWHIWTDPEWGYVTLQPVIHGDTWLFVTTIQAQELARATEPTAQSIQRLFGERLPSLKVSFRDLTWHSVYRRNLRIVDRYRAGRVFLAGDSAHAGVEHGMNIGIQDGLNLSWKLASTLRGASESLLETYHEERWPIARNILDATLARDRKSSGSAAAAQSITNAVLNKDTANDPTQLSVAYRDSPLSCGLDLLGVIRAGDRAPDAPGLTSPTGERLRLFEIRDGTTFTLLHFTSGPPLIALRSNDFLAVWRILKLGCPADPDAHTLSDSEGNGHRAYGIDSEALVLIRPDGYIGATGVRDRFSEIMRHLHLASA